MTSSQIILGYINSDKDKLFSAKQIIKDHTQFTERTVRTILHRLYIKKLIKKPFYGWWQSVDGITPEHHPKATTVEAEAYEAPVRQAPAAPGDFGNESVVHDSKEAIEILSTLRDPFTPTDLTARLDGPGVRAYVWLAHWQKAGWIVDVGIQLYRKTATNGND